MWLSTNRNVLDNIPGGTPPCAGPERDERDSDPDRGHWAPRIHTPSHRLATPDSQERPSEVAWWFPGSYLVELTFLEESTIPDACNSGQKMFTLGDCLKHKQTWQKSVAYLKPQSDCMCTVTYLYIRILRPDEVHLLWLKFDCNLQSK